MTRILLLAVLAIGLIRPSVAQSILNPSELDRLFPDPPKVEINLRGSLLRLAAQATSDDDPAVSEMIRGLRSISVRIFPVNVEDVDLKNAVDDLGGRFEDAGWLTLVRVRADREPDPDTGDRDGDVWVYVLDDGNMFNGLALMAMDPDDATATFVIIDGVIDPEMVGQLTSRFGKVDIDQESDEDGDDDN